MSQRAAAGFAGFVPRGVLCNTVPAYPYCGPVSLLPNQPSSLKPRARLSYIQNSGPWRQQYDAGSACLRPSTEDYRQVTHSPGAQQGPTPDSPCDVRHGQWSSRVEHSSDRYGLWSPPVKPSVHPYGLWWARRETSDNYHGLWLSLPKPPAAPDTED
jgi:hypothetical protein